MERDVSSWPIPVPVRSERWLPWAFLLGLFLASNMVFFENLHALQELRPPTNPAYNAFFLTPGRHQWVFTRNGECVGAVVGGWKVGKEDEIVRLHYYGRDCNEILVRGRFSQYKILKAAEIKLPERTIQFDGKNWTEPVTKEPIALIDTRDRRKFLRLPDHLARLLHRELNEFHPAGTELEQVGRSRFDACRSELNKDRKSGNF